MNAAYVSKPDSTRAERMIRLRALISHEQCRSATRGSSWSLLDRFLYRGMRTMLFHRELEALRGAARRALLRNLNEGRGGLWRNGMDYSRIVRLIWGLRCRSAAFALGWNVDAGDGLELLLAKAAF